MNIDQRGWHVGKEIPVAVLVVLIVQTAGIVWWASSLSASVSEATRKITALEIKTEAGNQRLNDLSADTKVNTTKTESVADAIKNLTIQVEFVRQESTRRAMQERERGR